MTHQQVFVRQVVDNIINGNLTTARGQLMQASTPTTLDVLEVLSYEMTEDEINTHGTPLQAAIARLRRISMVGA